MIDTLVIITTYWLGFSAFYIIILIEMELQSLIIILKSKILQHSTMHYHVATMAYASFCEFYQLNSKLPAWTMELFVYNNNGSHRCLMFSEITHKIHLQLVIFQYNISYSYYYCNGLTNKCKSIWVFYNMMDKWSHFSHDVYSNLLLLPSNLICDGSTGIIIPQKTNLEWTSFNVGLTFDHTEYLLWMSMA